MRILAKLFIILAVLAGAVYLAAGFAAEPAIEISRPAKMIGRATPLDLSVEAPGGRLTRVEVMIEQKGKRIPVFSLDQTFDATVKQETPDRIRITRTVGKQAIPDLEQGAATIVVSAARPVLYGLRTRETNVTRDVQLRFDPPRVSVLSTHHFVNHGGSEMVVYRVTPPDVESGVRVGELSYPGYAASGAGVQGADPSVKVAFFALLYVQDLGAPIELYARDEAANETRAEFPRRVFPKRFRRSRIELNDAFLQRIVPAIARQSPDVQVETAGELLPAFLKINGELRQKNAEKIASLAEATVPRVLWQGPFVQLGGSQVEAGFADHRTYFYKGQEVDQQVHLGFDLAVTEAIPVRAANDGKVLFADYLGIYGNCVIIDHGMGVQSLYGHLSSLDVGMGDAVQKNQTIGRSGMTGLAAGDHLHFTMLMRGYPVNPVEWWDPHWIQDRVTRKLREAAATGTSS